MRKFWTFILTIVILLQACADNVNPPSKVKKRALNFRKLTRQELKFYNTKSEQFYNKVLRNNFSGGIIVAKNGQIIFEAYNGYSNFQNKELLTENTPIHLASVSKTFTGIAILKLWEEGKLKLEDSIQQYFPNFPYHSINIQQLLSHRSGLPNYLYFMDTAWHSTTKATNNDVLNYLIDKRPAAYATPNRVFHYCNTNYVLLALIIEKLTGHNYPDYLKETIFIPLGMKNSFVFSIVDTVKYKPSYNYNNQPFKLENLDCIYGDKNIYSTVRDMLLWDQALYDTSFIKKSSLDKAFTPYSNEHSGKKNYGLGWRLYIDGKDTTIYHNGWWHGNNTVFTRLIKDTATIITLGNKYNRMIYTSRQLVNVFTNNNVEQDLEE
jgi:CubicO group peptidase (beta-lactamase class C family)